MTTSPINPILPRHMQTTMHHLSLPLFPLRVATYLSPSSPYPTESLAWLRDPGLLILAADTAPSTHPGSCGCLGSAVRPRRWGNPRTRCTPARPRRMRTFRRRPCIALPLRRTCILSEEQGVTQEKMPLTRNRVSAKLFALVGKERDWCSFYRGFWLKGWFLRDWMGRDAMFVCLLWLWTPSQRQKSTVCIFVTIHKTFHQSSDY